MSVRSDETGPFGGRAATIAVVVAALGYLVDIYDLILFSVVRRPSLASLGIEEAAQLTVGLALLRWQMIGMLVGGVLWGVLGDRRGRLSVLFGSILMYSLANIANGLVRELAGATGVDVVTTYALLRFVAGVGLAGELGAGVTLVAELMPAKSRGYATTLIAGIGICGAILAVLVSRVVEWNVAYFIGGALGLVLLALRVGVLESGIFERVKASDVSRGDFLMLFRPLSRARRYLAVVLCGVPIWFAIGILVTGAPELGRDLGLTEQPNAGTAVLWAYVGLAVGDFGSGVLSQLIRSRKRAIFASLLLNALAVAGYFTIGASSVMAFYGCIFVLGVANGYWAVFVTVAAEKFGTNLRATATTSAPNFVRGSLALVEPAFTALSGPMGRPGAALAVGVVVLVVAFVATALLDETYGRDLDFVES